MRRTSLLLWSSTFLAIGAACAIAACASGPAAPSASSAPLLVAAQTPAEVPSMSRYPKAPSSSTVDVYAGRSVADPFRPLENPDAPETQKWIEAENKLTFGLLSQIPAREQLKQRLTTLWNFERYSPPSVEGKGKNKRLFFWKNDGLQNQSVLHVVDPGQTEPRVLLDPNAMSKDGTVAVSGLSVSDDGTKMAYAISSGGSDWQDWRVLDVATGKDLPDVLHWSKFSGASWAKDGSGFWYSRYPEPSKGADLEEANYFHKLYFHKLGTAQDADVLVLDDPANKTRGFGASITEDGRYLVANVWEGTDRRNRLYFLDARKPGANWMRVFDDFDASYNFVGNVGSTIYIQTDLDAPRQRLVRFDLATFRADGKGAAKPVLVDVIAQHETDKLENVGLLGKGILARWLHNAHDAVTFHDLKGKKLRDFALPTIGTSGGFSGKQNDTETYYSFTSFTYPTVIYKLDLLTGKTTLWKQPKVDFDPGAFETKQVVYTSKDGTKVPMFIVHKKGIAYDSNNPTYLYGYGGFNISLTPAFSVGLIAWLERGGVYAQPSLRGGGEFGEDWHQAGMLDKKQNVFDDFAAAAQYLSTEKIASPSKIGIGGGSNGGLLVGASITQHPELFGAALAAVGVMDMMRFHTFTIGHAWTSEYGSSADDKMVPVLLAYSPLHNTKKGTHYPPTMILTADHDDRVVPAHSFKFAAALQEAQGGPAPVLIRVDTKAGHGAGKPTTKLIEEAADRWAFLLAALGVEKMPELP